MLPPSRMLATKKQAGALTALTGALAALVLFAGCTPAGPRALLKGERLVRAGKYPPAIEKLEEATRLLPNHAQAWNHLGLAYHGAQRLDDATQAYLRALSIDRDLAAARYNLGSLYLERTNLPAAIRELTTYVELRPNAETGWFKLGMAQLRAGQSEPAERSFAKALQLNHNLAAALNGLGLAQVQRGRHREAYQRFLAASRGQPAYAPAVLNAAVVAQQHLNDRPAALQKYQEYLALKPPPPNRAAVQQVISQLQAELLLAAAVTSPGSPSPRTSEAAAPITFRRDPRLIDSRSTSAAPASFPATSPPRKVETARAGSNELAVAARSANAKPAAPPAIATDTTSETAPSKRTEARAVELASIEKPRPVPAPDGTAPAAGSRSTVPRYPYRTLAPPQPGDRTEAERLISQGLRAQERYRLTEAIEYYRQASNADPALFEAQYNLGVAAYEAGRLPEALAACESALAISPSSMKARYNFAVALEKAGYPRDAANEFEKIVAENPGEVRAHLILGNLYAEKLREPQKAKEHYLRVLQLDSQHPQATAIRYWLEANP